MKAPRIDPERKVQRARTRRTGTRTNTPKIDFPRFILYRSSQSSSCYARHRLAAGCTSTDYSINSPGGIPKSHSVQTALVRLLAEKADNRGKDPSLRVLFAYGHRFGASHLAIVNQTGAVRHPLRPKGPPKPWTAHPATSVSAWVTC